jgi:TPR repeat protein
MPLRGTRGGIDKSLAARCFKLAVDQGNRDAFVSYGLCLFTGDGIAVNKSRAAYMYMYYYKLATDQGDAYAQYLLARASPMGKGLR